MYMKTTTVMFTNEQHTIDIHRTYLAMKYTLLNDNMLRESELVEQDQQQVLLLIKMAISLSLCILKSAQMCICQVHIIHAFIG